MVFKLSIYGSHVAVGVNEITALCFLYKFREKLPRII